MHIENPEIDTWMPDWSPNRITPVTTPNSRGGLDPFALSQRVVLLQLREHIVDAVAEVATLSRSKDNEAPSLKTHQADVASDTYDRDFALSLLSHEKDALHEIDQALRRIDLGKYGICEMSGKAIPRARLEAIPFARFTVEVQSRIEKQKKTLLLPQSTRLSLLPTEIEEEAETDYGDPPFEPDTNDTRLSKS